MDTSRRADKQRDAEIIRGFYAGDFEATSVIDSWIYSVIQNPRWGLGPDMEDVHQDIRLRLVESLEDFEYRSSLKTYVCRIAIYACVDEMRARRRRGSPTSVDEIPEPPDPGPGPLEQIEAAERSGLFDKIMQMALPECRDLWRMIYVEEMTSAEIADLLGIKPGTVKSRASRCREKTRAALKNLARERNRYPG